MRGREAARAVERAKPVTPEVELVAAWASRRPIDGRRFVLLWGVFDFTKNPFFGFALVLGAAVHDFFSLPSIAFLFLPFGLPFLSLLSLFFLS
jgi:hypothetical protein